MYLFGYTLDNLSLMALTIATGFVVDDAIVVMENITRHLEAGMEPFAAAFLGAKEIGFTIFSISMSLVAVFIPILLMGGIVGRLFREFAVTLSTAIVISMIVSLTTTPICAPISSRRAARTSATTWFYRISEKAFNTVMGYLPRFAPLGPRQLRPDRHCFPAHHRPEYRHSLPHPQGLLPPAGHRRGRRRRPGSSGRILPLHGFRARQIVNVIKSDPAVAHVNAYTGNGNGGFVYTALKPLGTKCKDSAANCDFRQTTPWT